jgi:hypothetical protein
MDSYQIGWRKRYALLASQMIGKRFGRLTVIAMAPSRKSGNGGMRWRCRCVCGGKTITRASALWSGEAKSCGCLQKERASAVAIKNSTKHGHAPRGKPSPEYITWQSMHARCSNPKHTVYRYYGGRGITVCARWYSFKNFLADMGPRPAGKTLDRYPDPNGNYKPSNCRWATSSQQQQNKRRPPVP